MARSRKDPEDGPEEKRRETLRAAQYVRMSTDHQKYSTENQSDAIAKYAARRGIDIVRKYADHGKSGLSLHGRDALKQLISDVQAGQADFELILVYDISRWGRFQDADESAYLEHICKRAGIVIRYCAEQFENDGSISSTIVKTIRRAMAGEYSRELSVKVFTGQCRLVEKGYRQGGMAGYGLRRLLVDENGRSKGELALGQRKSIQTDRVILVPGPEDEVRTVNRMYRMFVFEGKLEVHIARILNAEGLKTDLDWPWTRRTVHQILTAEKYAGNNVFNRQSCKLKGKRVTNSPGAWIRADSVYQPVVDPELFAAAQRIIRNGRKRYSKDGMLEQLRALLAKHGSLSSVVIDGAPGAVSSSTFRHRFGSLLRAYKLIGHVPQPSYQHLEINRSLRRIYPEAVRQAIAGIEAVGGTVTVDSNNDLLTVNDEWTASIVIARCLETRRGNLRWRIRLDAHLRPDITVALRMEQGNTEIRDCYLLPCVDMDGASEVYLREDNGIAVDTYRFGSLGALFAFAARSTIQVAA